MTRDFDSAHWSARSIPTTAASATAPSYVPTPRRENVDRDIADREPVDTRPRPQLLPAADASEFAAAPVGRWLAFDNGAAWCAAPTLMGVVCWGRPSSVEVWEMLSLLARVQTGEARFDLLIDAARVQRVSPEAFATLVEWSRASGAALRARLRRCVAVVPPGVSTLAREGVSVSVGGLEGVELASHARAALETLRPGRADEVHACVESVVAHSGAGADFLVELRARLDVHRGDLSLPDAARQLRMSTRSLQRRLGRAGTTYRREVQDARFRALSKLLASGDEKLWAVAQSLGVTTTALAALVRARTNLTITQFRRGLRDA